MESKPGHLNGLSLTFQTIGNVIKSVQFLQCKPFKFCTMSCHISISKT